MLNQLYLICKLFFYTTYHIFMATYSQYYYTLPSGIDFIMVGGLDEIYMILNNLSCYEVIKLLEEFVFSCILKNLYQNESNY